MQLTMGLVIKKIRETHLYSQARLANELDLAEEYIKELENGTHKPSYKFIYIFCKLFDIGINPIPSYMLNLVNNTDLDEKMHQEYNAYIEKVKNKKR